MAITLFLLWNKNQVRATNDRQSIKNSNIEIRKIYALKFPIENYFTQIKGGGVLKLILNQKKT